MRDTMTTSMASKKKAKKKVAKKRKGAAKKRVSKSKLFVMTLQVNGMEIKSKGKTSLEAYQGIAVGPMLMKTKGIVILEHDGKRSEKVFYPFQLRKMFASDIARQVWAKRMELILR